MQSMDRGLDSAVGGLAEPADRRVLHRRTNLVGQRNLAWPSAAGPAADDPVERLFLAYGADSARHALATRFVPKERRDALDDAVEIDRVVKDQEYTRAQGRLCRARPLEAERHSELVGSDENAGGAAEEDRLERAT